MLTKKQLEDACRCHLTICHECEMAGEYIKPEESCVERAAETALAYRDVAIRLYDAASNYCPVCDSNFGHKPGCKFAELLKEAP
jgi:hypothetical protein